MLLAVPCHHVLTLDVQRGWKEPDRKEPDKTLPADDIGESQKLTIKHKLSKIDKSYGSNLKVLTLEKNGQCEKEPDNVGKNRTTFLVLAVRFFPTPLYLSF